jgi:hypothetical protein
LGRPRDCGRLTRHRSRIALRRSILPLDRAHQLVAMPKRIALSHEGGKLTGLLERQTSAFEARSREDLYPLSHAHRTVGFRGVPDIGTTRPLMKGMRAQLEKLRRDAAEFDNRIVLWLHASSFNAR